MLVMKRAETEIIAALLFKGYIFGDNGNNIVFVAYLLDEFAGIKHNALLLRYLTGILHVVFRGMKFAEYFRAMNNE